MTEDQFVTLLAEAYEHLYDLVYLRTHPLTEWFPHDKGNSAKEHAWNVHHVLLDVIRELDPGPKAPVFSREWRRHRLLNLRYADGLSAQAVADQLAISRRHYYRAHDEAIKAIAGILWNRYSALPRSTPDAPAPGATPSSALVDRMELVRLEAAQMSRVDQQTDIPAVLERILSLLSEQLQQHRLEVTRDIGSSVPKVAVDPRLFRQLLLGLAGYMVERARDATLICRVETAGAVARLCIEIAPPSAIQTSASADTNERLAALEELRALCNVAVTPQTDGAEIVGFAVDLPLFQEQRTILVIDDNDDILELLQRYLRLSHYDVVTAENGHQGLELALQNRPAAIILDLMMPELDGWDLLQLFLHQPATHTIPIIVCSVLRQKELALSLGATAFLEKPVSEQQLMNVLDRVMGSVP